MMGDFKPSSVNLLGSFPPLCATFGKTEMECAAALLVRTMVENGDSWRSVTFPEVIQRVADDVLARSRPVSDMVVNPFCEPDFHGLIAGGFLKLSEPELDSTSLSSLIKDTLEFTEAGIERLRKWVR